jgi:uncharacterized membrane protein YhfC
MQQPFQINPFYLAEQTAAVVFNIVAPIVIAVIARRRLGVGWRYWGFGALIFTLFQLLTRVPATQVAQMLLAPQLRGSQTFAYGWLVVLTVTAGLAEEWGRYVGYRWLMGKEEKTWPKAVMYGLGHGGIESIVLVGGLGILGIVNLVVLSRLDLATLPMSDEQRQQLAVQMAALASQPAWFPLLASWERLCAMALHVGLSVLVLQSFTQGGLRWVWLSVLLHTLANLVVMGAPLVVGMSGTQAALLQEALMLPVAALGIALTLWGRSRRVTSS